MTGSNGYKRLQMVYSVGNYMANCTHNSYSTSHFPHGSRAVYENNEYKEPKKQSAGGRYKNCSTGAHICTASP
eukprot:4733274-Amphidinium_carterae.2